MTPNDHPGLDAIHPTRYGSQRAGKLACPATYQELATPKVGSAASGARREANPEAAKTSSHGSSQTASAHAPPAAHHASTPGARSISRPNRRSGSVSMTYERRRRGDMEALQDAERETDRDRLDRWRTGELPKRGFDSHEIELLVAADVSLHDVDRLIGNGCPVTTALLILL